MCPLDSEGTTLSSAALIGHDGGVWAQSPSFPEITAEESSAIMTMLSTGTSETGSFTIGGVKYFVLMSEDPENKIRGKCQGGGCAINKTGQTLVVGIWAGKKCLGMFVVQMILISITCTLSHAEPIQPSACNRVVEALGEYLLSVNY
jgi:profilin